MTPTMALYQSVALRLPGVSFECFEQSLAPWELIPVVMGGHTIGAIMRRGPELHVGLNVRAPGSVRRFIREVLQETIKRHGAATTKVQKDNLAGLQFCARLGFKLSGEEGDALLLRCEKANYA